MVSDTFVFINLNLNRNTHLVVSVSSSSSRVAVGLKYFDMADKPHGIVHIIGLEQGFTLLGTIRFYRSTRMATYGAFGVITFGVATA